MIFNGNFYRYPIYSHMNQCYSFLLEPSKEELEIMHKQNMEKVKLEKEKKLNDLEKRYHEKLLQNKLNFENDMKKVSQGYFLPNPYQPNYNYQQEPEQENYYEENENFDDGREEYNVIEDDKLNKEETIDKEE